MTSAPIPACRCFESFSIPSEKPTITRMSVTSRAMAMMLISDRTGRCTRLATIIRFINFLFVFFWFKCSVGLLRRRLVAVLCVQRARLIGLIEMDDLCSRRLLQRKLLIVERLVNIQLQNRKGYGVSLFRTVNLDLRRELHTPKILVIVVMGVRRDFAFQVVNHLLMHAKVSAAEHDFAR